MQQLDPLDKARSHFLQLITKQPNFFGNLGDDAGPISEKKIADSHYEDIDCVGYDPVNRRLAATVAIKQSNGYLGDLCSAGSREHVRFYLDTGDGWTDQGLATFEVHDIPTGKDCSGARTKPLTYAASVTLEPTQKPCRIPQLPRIRAILSWQDAPPADSPDWRPVWGAVQDASIQIQPGPETLHGLWEILKDQIVQPIQLPPEFLPIQTEPLLTPKVVAADFKDLASKYLHKASENTKVEPHRFGAPHLALLAQGNLEADLKASIAQEWELADLDLPEALGPFFDIEKETRYEEVDCLAFDPNREELVATFRIKRPTGYLGNLCQEGSKEYISFFADWDDDCGDWDHLGTLSLDVHDIAKIPKDGLHYAMYLPVDLKHHRRPCERPKVGRVRAVLSWNTPPGGANDPPRWGNALDAHVLIPPGETLQPGEIRPLFDRIGGIRTRDIHDLTGLTGPQASFLNGRPADGLQRPCPFGRRVLIQGPPFVGQRYRIQVRPDGGVWSSLVNTMTLSPLTGPNYAKSPEVGTDTYSYESIARNPGMVLGWWETTGDDLWEVKLEILGHGEIRHMVQLKNSGIKARDIHIDAGGDCGRFSIGTVLEGDFVAQDDYLAGYSLGTSPFAAPAGQLTPTRGNVSTPDAPGSRWSLDTAGMKACGYVVNLHVSDRAILDSIGVGHRASASVGFCLLD